MSEEKKLKIDRIRYIVVSFLIDDGEEIVERKVKLDNMLFPEITRLNDYVNEIYNKKNFMINDTIAIGMYAACCEVIEED